VLEKLNNVRRQNDEEFWNIITHGVAIILSFICFLILLSRTALASNDFKLVSVILFGLSSLFVYIASTVYHYNWDKPLRKIFRTIDHISIFYLIAGSYSPFMLVTFDADKGWRLFIIVWVVAFCGTVFKIFFTGKYENFSLFLYVALGWTVLLEYEEFVSSTPSTTFNLLLAGGLLYCVGVVFYRLDKIKYNHAIWHVFVVAANLLHFMAVYTIL